MIDYKTKHRKYKIANIIGKEYNDMDFNKIYNHYKQNMDISKMKMFINDYYPNTIYYGYSKDYIYIERNIKTNSFYLDYDKIWSFFETDFDYNFKEIKELTTTILKEHLNLKELTTENELVNVGSGFKDHLNLKELTTGQHFLNDENSSRNT